MAENETARDTAAFQPIAQNVAPKKAERVKAVTVRLCISNCTGILRVTDLMFQPGGAATGWVGNVSEMPFTLEG